MKQLLKKLFPFILLFLGRICFGQNLVPNPSFEIYSPCPNAFNQISYATGWIAANGTSPDYNNACSSNPNFSVPNNLFGHQPAATGTGYADICIYSTGFSNAREFIANQLTDSLIIGQKYFASIKVSAAYNPYVSYNFACFANNIGLTLTTINYSQFNPNPITNYAHVYSVNVINDTVNWITIQGSFIADSSYKYIVIGNFFDDSITTVVCDSNSIWAYIYVDDVCLSTDSLLCYAPVKIDENSNTDFFEIYPNPSTSNYINIDASIENYSLIIFNELGQEILKKQKIPRHTTIDISDIPNGILFIKIIYNNQIKYYKLIKS